MRLDDITVEQAIQALRNERAAWVAAAEDESGRHTDPERIVICTLSAVEGVLLRIQEAASENAASRVPQPDRDSSNEEATDRKALGRWNNEGGAGRNSNDQ